MASSITSTRSRSASASIKRGLTVSPSPSSGGLVNHLEWRQGASFPAAFPRWCRQRQGRRAKVVLPSPGLPCTMVTFPKGIYGSHSHSTVCVSTSLMADNLDGFFLRRLFQAVNCFLDILPVCDFCRCCNTSFQSLNSAQGGGRSSPPAQAPQGGYKRRFRLVAVKAEVNGLDVRTVRKETQ